ncbi:MAG: phosphate--AMP phosphotransferase [Gemmatimonadetes bacterium]|nr:phosphate--AMP phosphotransferase [Gemmatimonadota bacterium]
MLETLDLAKSIAKDAYDKSFRELRDKLRDLQRATFEAKIPVMVAFEGWDAAGKGDSIQKLVERLDPRGVKVHPVSAPLEEERLRPFLWRFWTKVPGRGEVAVFDRSWYGRVLVERVDELITRQQWESAYDEINQFERMLADDGMVIVKLWLHISEKEQKKRFKEIEKSEYDAWRVTKEDWKAHKHYEDYLRAAEEMLERTSTAYAPWTVVEATDKRYRLIRVFKTLADAMQTALDAKGEEAKPRRTARASVAVQALKEMKTVLDTVDLDQALSVKKYDGDLKEYQVRLRQLEYRCFEERRPVIVAYEGWDAAGKGGNIRRVTECLDPRGYTVIPIAAPKGDEATHHYLWRFWKHIPKAGHLAIFDRTWYGRVLVERVEGFCAEPEWRRAFQEINEFELSLANFGAILVKFWLHISQEEQLRRFKEREKIEHKRYKITDEDWRNRDKFGVYRAAVVDMLQNTSTTYAPWTIVEANDKLWARIRALRTIVEAIDVGLGNRKKKKKHKA